MKVTVENNIWHENITRHMRLVFLRKWHAQQLEC